MLKECNYGHHAHLWKVQFLGSTGMKVRLIAPELILMLALGSELLMSRFMLR